MEVMTLLVLAERVFKFWAREKGKNHLKSYHADEGVGRQQRSTSTFNSHILGCLLAFATLIGPSSVLVECIEVAIIFLRLFPVTPTAAICLPSTEPTSAIVVSIRLLLTLRGPIPTLSRSR